MGFIRIQKHLKLYDLSLLLVLISFLPPQIIYYVIPYSRILIYMLRISSSALFFALSNSKKPNEKRKDTFSFFIFILIFGLAESILDLVKELDVSAFRYFLFYVLFAFILYTTAQNKPILLINEAILIFGVYNFLQILSVLIFFPGGMVATEGGIKASAVYFLGGKNQAFIFMFIFLLSITVKASLYCQKISKWTFIILFAFMVESILIDSMASLVCLAIFGIAFFIVSSKIYRSIAPTLNPYFLFIVAIILFVVFCIINTLSAFSETSFIAELFHRYGRNLSFTGRTFIWKQSLDMFIENPLIGGNGEYTINQVAINQAHNAFLDVLGKYGLFGFIPYISIIASLTTILYKMKRNKKLYVLCSVSFFTLLVHCMFEYMDFYCMLFIFFIYISSKEAASHNVYFRLCMDPVLKGRKALERQRNNRIII